MGGPIYADYQSRRLDYCHFCGEKYNVGARIPRILVHCGHTFCTECLSQYLFRNFRVRCPICCKLVKNLETPDRLPLNINILYEVVERDPVLSQIDFDGQDYSGKLCAPHNDRIKHFYCSNHQSVFCRECIPVAHTDERCFVVDLYEIEKMRKLKAQNIANNKGQLHKRKDGPTVSCVVVETFKPHVPHDHHHHHHVKAKPQHHAGGPKTEDQLTDEGRTNEDLLEDYPAATTDKPSTYFNEELAADYGEESSEQEEGQFNQLAYEKALLIAKM